MGGQWDARREKAKTVTMGLGADCACVSHSLCLQSAPRILAGKIVVNLWDDRVLENGLAAIVVPAMTGVVYVQQAGGTACCHPEFEGYAVPARIPEEILCAGTACWRHPLEPDLQEYLTKLFIDHGCRFTFDPSRAQYGMEAWLPILMMGDGPPWLSYPNCD
jgi:hypothetical protein